MFIRLKRQGATRTKGWSEGLSMDRKGMRNPWYILLTYSRQKTLSVISERGVNEKTLTSRLNLYRA